MNPTRIVHIITGLRTGGAETTLLRVLSALKRDRFDLSVISLISPEPVGKRISQLGIPVRFLGMDARRPNISSFIKLVGWLREIRPDVIQTWMYHADLLGGLAGFLTHTPVVWGIRNTSLDPSAVKSSTIRVVHINAHLSGWLPRRIVSCSTSAYLAHVNIGYSQNKFVVIPNGFDLKDFRPNPAARISLRQELELPIDALIIGLVARFDPLKDHKDFLRAAAIFSRGHTQAHFVLCGTDVSWSNEVLSGWIDAAGIRQNCHLLGRRNDIARLMQAFDVNTLSSIGEAFPNVLGEAMACETLCVTTDVGDAAEIVGDTGIVVPPSDPHALANGWEQIISMPLQERIRQGRRARERIRLHYEIHQIAKQYESLYQDVIQTK